LTRQNQNGKGFADVLFTPIDPSAPSLVVELKVDEKASDALDQLKDRNYQAAIKSKRFTGSMLLVAITYDRKTKVHDCLIEELV
jgi:hypothetical protein